MVSDLELTLARFLPLAQKLFESNYRNTRTNPSNRLVHHNTRCSLSLGYGMVVWKSKKP